MKRTFIALLLFVAGTLTAQNAQPQDSTQSIVSSIIGWYDANMNYGSITALMDSAEKAPIPATMMPIFSMEE